MVKDVEKTISEDVAQNSEAYIDGVYVVLGNNRYNLVKKGRHQADQIVNLTRWIAKHGTKIAGALAGTDGKITIGTIGESLDKLAEGLTTDSLLDLFVIATGCTQKNADDYFDVDLLIECAGTVYNNQTAIKRLVERFFSRTNSTPNTEESFTPSEVLTDGQTTQ